MGVKWAGAVAKIILCSILAAIAFMLITWGILFVQSSNIVSDRLSDLVYIVSEENCLSEDGTQPKSSSLGVYENLLQTSETSWLKFETSIYDGASKNSADYAYFVGSPTNTTKWYLGYEAAPQRGTAIKVTVKGVLHLPFFVRFGGKTGSNDGGLSINVPIEKSFVTMGMKYYKDKG